MIFKFRQAIFKDDTFHHWHYWGYAGYRGKFVAPISIHQDSYPSTYTVKESQLYSGKRSGKLGLGEEIWEGDLITSPPLRGPCLVKFGEHTDIAEAGCTSHSNIGFYVQAPSGEQAGLWNEELLSDWESFDVMGNNHENPELLATGMA